MLNFEFANSANSFWRKEKWSLENCATTYTMPDSDREYSDLAKTKDGSQVDGVGNALSPSASGQGQNGRQNLVKYGELVILGYNGQLPQGKSR